MNIAFQEVENMRYGLIGEKLGHSFSKEIHEKIADYTYDLIPLTKHEFHTFMKQKDFAAINVTIPYKKDVIPYLDEMDMQAKSIGAVNTIVNKNGKLIGHNTDFDGFLYMVRHHNIHMKDKKVLIIGNGGAAQAVKAVVKHEQAKEIIIVDIIKTEDTITYDECYALHSDAQIIINTSPVGMFPSIDASPLHLEYFKQCEALLDVIYNPILTKLAFTAQELGIKRVNGLEMLVAQAKYAVEHFLDTKIDDDIIDKIYKELLMKECNIILIGMPSAGKTTIGKMLEQRMDKKFIDLDDVIVEKAGITIPEIFDLFGEEGFRHLETLVAKELSAMHNMIIATGGGTIKNKENMDALRLNGIIIFIDRDINKLMTSDPNRPLLKNEDALKSLHKERYPLYQKYASMVVMNNEAIEQTIEDVIHAYQSIILEAVEI